MPKNSTYTPASTNPNNARSLILDSHSEANNAIVADPVTARRTDVDKGAETQAAYNLRVPVGVQPVQPKPTKSYLGNNL